MDRSNQHSSPNETGTLTRKTISNAGGTKLKTLGQISTKLNQTAGEGSRHQERWKAKLRPSNGKLWAPHKPITRKSILQTREVRHTEERQKPRHKPPMTSKDKYGWVRGDQTTIIQGYAQPPRTCKRQIETPSSNSQKP